MPIYIFLTFSFISTSQSTPLQLYFHPPQPACVMVDELNKQKKQRAHFDFLLIYVNYLCLPCCLYLERLLSFILQQSVINAPTPLYILILLPPLPPLRSTSNY